MSTHQLLAIVAAVLLSGRNNHEAGCSYDVIKMAVDDAELIIRAAYDAELPK